jgi:hypothetical protein
MYDKISGTDLPDHTEQLSQAESLIEKYKTELKEFRPTIVRDNKSYSIFHHKIVQLLEYIGDLSLPAFKISNALEEEYFKRYKHAPEMARKMWTTHYHRVHKPYNVLKNRCFTLLDRLEEEYFRNHNVLPPSEF